MAARSKEKRPPYLQETGRVCGHILFFDLAGRFACEDMKTYRNVVFLVFRTLLGRNRLFLWKISGNEFAISIKGRAVRGGGL